MYILEALNAYAKTNRIALINREESLSFTALDAQSDAFAEWLLAQCGDDRTPIVIYGAKETAFLPCIFGALKSGRGYVPIEGSVPAARAAQIAADISPRVVVDFGGLGVEMDSVRLDVGRIGEILHTPLAAPLPREHWISGDTPAYILFTSGSTGKPKGVPISANNLSAFYRGLLPYYPAGENVILNQSSYSFDVSGCSLYAGLTQGMTLFTVDHEMMEDMGQLFSHLQKSGLTLWVSTPSLAELCVQSQAFSAALLPALRQFLFCGEVLTHKLCDQLAERFPQARVVNTYGPTEATVLVTAVAITDELRRDSRPIPIGKPIAGTELRLVDEQGQSITEEEQSGELLILGESVGIGYFARPDLTEKAFFTDNATGKRGYSTGDICYRIGNLYYYSGRADNQLKLNGFRIELEDIENNLEKLPNIARAAVVPVLEGEKVQYLAAFLLLEQPDNLSALARSMQVKRELSALLPTYMIPRKLFAVDAFPLNVNGKVDKKELARRLQEDVRR